MAQDLGFAEFAGRRIATPGKGHDARMSASQRHDTPARRFRRWDFLGLARAQLAVLTIEDYDDEIGDARHGRGGSASTAIRRHLPEGMRCADRLAGRAAVERLDIRALGNALGPPR
jgi:hypothetical protein